MASALRFAGACGGSAGGTVPRGRPKKGGTRKQRLPPLELSRHEAGVSCFQNYGLLVVVTVRHRSLTPADGWQLPSVELTTTVTLPEISAKSGALASVMVSA